MGSCNTDHWAVREEHTHSLHQTSGNNPQSSQDYVLTHRFTVSANHMLLEFSIFQDPPPPPPKIKIKKCEKVESKGKMSKKVGLHPAIEEMM